MAAAGHVDTLVGGNITLGPFPPTVAHTAPFQVLTISTAENWTGCCEESKHLILREYCPRLHGGFLKTVKVCYVSDSLTINLHYKHNLFITECTIPVSTELREV